MLMLLGTILLAGCAQMGLQEETCTGPDAIPVIIHYGDSQVRASPPRRNVNRGDHFVFTLNAINSGNPADPDYINYRDVTVTVKGKTGAGWIKERSGTWNSTAPNHKFRICVPAMQALGKYYYEVTVTGVGNLDPRVDVN